MAQPDGLVVTTTALKAAEANITWPVIELQATLRDLAGETKVVLDLRRFFEDILEWSSEFVVDREHLPEALRVPLDGGDFLTPHFAVRSADQDGKFILLVGLPEKLGGDACRSQRILSSAATASRSSGVPGLIDPSSSTGSTNSVGRTAQTN